MSSEYNEKIGQALDIYFNKKFSQLGYDQTIIAEISEIVDSINGKYKIKYESAIFDAESINLEKEYKINRSVYVKVPQGDFSNKLLIESEVDSDFSMLKANLKELSEYKILIEPTFNYESDFSLVAGPEKISNKDNPQSQTIEYYQGLTTSQEIEFNSLAKQYEVIKLEATFRNSLINIHNKGNYGLKFTFLTSNPDEEEVFKTFTLDTNQFSGNFYSNNVGGGKQFIYQRLPKGTLKGLKSITFFQEGMEQDKDIKSPIIEKGEVVGYPLVDTINLQVSDIQISFYDIANIMEQNMYLNLVAENGFYNKPEISELRFEAQLLNKGDNIIDKYYTYWYKKVKEMPEDASITKAGQGWVLQNEASSSNIALVPPDVIELYKIMILDEETEIIAEKEFYIYPDSSSEIPKIIQQDDKVKQTITLSLPSGMVGEWQFDGVSKGISNSIVIKHSDFSFGKNSMLVECWVQGVVTSLYVNPPIADKEVLISFSGKVNYQYNTKGELYIEDAKKEKELIIASLVGEQLQGLERNHKCWIGEFEITNKKEDWKKYENTNSMLEDVYFTISEAGSCIIHYTINPRYNQNKTNNTISYNLSFGNENYYGFTETKDIIFSRAGDLGANGSEFGCRLVPENSYCNLSGEDDYIVNLEVYEKGQKIETNYNEEYEIVSLTLGNDTDLTNNVTHQQKLIIPVDLISPGEYIKFTVQIQGNVLTTYLGIPTAYGYAALPSQPPTPWVRYNADGKNPLYLQSSSNPSFDAEFTDEFLIKNHTVNNINYPIILYRNAYGNFTVSNWDNVAKVDEKNESVLARQVVGGSTHADVNGNPQFNGVIMGEVMDDTNKPKGIYGYKNNKTTFQITQDGIVKLGENEQIILDSQKGSIINGNSKITKNRIDTAILNATSVYYASLKYENNNIINGDRAEGLMVSPHDDGNYIQTINEALADIWNKIDSIKSCTCSEEKPTN